MGHAHRVITWQEIVTWYLGAKEDCAHPATCILLTLFQVALTCDPGGEGAAWNVLLIVLDQDAVVTRKHRQVGDATRPILVVGAADFCFGWALDGQGQAPWRESWGGLGLHLGTLH